MGTQETMMGERQLPPGGQLPPTPIEPVTSGSESTPRGDSTYVVQIEKTFEVSAPLEEVAAWVDVATVTVPARSKRKGIIAKALEKAGIAPEVGQDPLRVRVLDASSSAVTEVGVVQPEPELRIG